MNDVITLDENYSTTRRVIKADLQDIAGLVKQSHKPEDKFETVLFLPEGEGRQGEGGLRTKGYFKTGGIIPSPLTPNPSPEAKPLITVVTVVYNGEKFLEETILSVINQTYDNVEYIIIDGGSTDGTLDIIKKYEHAIDYWVSEKDKGIYDAMNKGIDLATGKLVGFVNADDYLYSSSLGAISAEYSLKKFDYTVGPVDLVNIQGVKTEVMSVVKDFYIDKKYLYKMPTSHQAFFITNALLKKIDKFDTNFKLSADFDMVVRAMHASGHYYEFQSSLSAFREGGASGSYDTFLENFRLYNKHGVNKVVAIRLTAISLLKVFVVRNFSTVIVRILRRIFSSGRYVKVSE